MTDPMMPDPMMPNIIPNEEEYEFDEAAAAKVTEWERLLADVGEDTGEPEEALLYMYQEQTQDTTEEPAPLEPSGMEPGAVPEPLDTGEPSV